LVVAEDNDILLGYAYGYMMGTAPIFITHKRGYIDEFGVTEQARGNKIGEALLDELILWFKENGAERVELKVDAFNTGGIQFWSKQGFLNTQVRMGKTI
jgi:ribosomal protein S18 acetylase RimI-like enzyme